MALFSGLLTPHSAVSAGGQICAFFKGTVNGGRFGTAQWFGNALAGKSGATQELKCPDTAQMVLQLLERGAFLTQAAAQRLRAAVQLTRDAVEVRPVRTVAPQQAADPTGQAVAAHGASEQVCGRTFQELFEGALIL